MRQVEKECGELDWTNAGGAAVGGSGVAIIEDDDDGDDDTRSRSGGGRKLGGGTSTSRLLLSQENLPEAEETQVYEGHRYPVSAPNVVTIAGDADAKKAVVPVSLEVGIETSSPAPLDVEMEDAQPDHQSESEDSIAVENSPDQAMEDAQELIPGYQPSTYPLLHVVWIQ